MNQAGVIDQANVSASSSGLTVVVGSAGELMPDLKTQWEDLVRASDVSIPFISWAWYDAWLDAFCPREDARLVAVFDDKRLVAALPFRVRGQRGSYGAQEITSWVNTHSFRWGLLCERGNDSAARALAKQLIQLEEWDSCVLNYAVSDSQALENFLYSLAQEGYIVESVPDMQSPVMKVPDDWDAFLASMPKKRRESERRKVRKLEKQGAKFKFVSGRCEDLAALLKDCWHISSKTWKQEKGSAIAADETRRSFYEAVANSAQDWICLALLYIDDEPIAFEFNLLFDGTLYSLKLGYNTDYARQSPGQVLRFKLFEWCIENDIDFFDFMGHRARYKDQYAERHIGHSNIRIYSKTPRGRVLGTYRTRIRPVLAGVKRKLVAMKQLLPQKTTTIGGG